MIPANEDLRENMPVNPDPVPFRLPLAGIEQARVDALAYPERELLADGDTPRGGSDYY